MLYVKSKAKQIVNKGDHLTKVIEETISSMADIVGSTLGPGGRPVLIERDDLPPLVTKDGVTVAKALGAADAQANILIDAAKEICIKTAKEAGDGTTTAIVLASELVKCGLEYLAANPKQNPQQVVNELKRCYESYAVPFIKSWSIPVETEDELKKVALISANGDLEIAEKVVSAVVAAGDDGTVLINESPDGVIKVDHVEGFVVTSGLKDIGQIGPVFINDKANQQVKMDNGFVVLYDGSLNDLKVPALIQDAVTDNGGFSDGTPILVFAHGFADTVLDKFAKTTKSGLTVVPVKVPRTGLPNGASMFLHDLAAYTCAKVYDPGNVDEMDLEGLGEFTSAHINMYESFLSSPSNSDLIEQRIQELKSIEAAAFSEMDKAFIRAAIARLTNGVATILVGGSSDLEIREKKGRVEDAVEAVRSAIAEGIVPGGCSLHLKLSNYLSTHEDSKDCWSVLIKALYAPFKRLVSNCGADFDEVSSSFFTVLNPKMKTYVFDARTHTIVDAFESGIIEPAKVVRVSVGNALSVASLLTTLGGMVYMPRNSDAEIQMEIANQTFKNMLSAAGDE
jgi:chaperonin GroEL